MVALCVSINILMVSLIVCALGNVDEDHSNIAFVGLRRDTAANGHGCARVNLSEISISPDLAMPEGCIALCSRQEHIHMILPQWPVHKQTEAWPTQHKYPRFHSTDWRGNTAQVDLDR